jgi:hypothetical protein
MKDSNDNEMLIDELVNLFNETAKAHHKAFAATEGEDPDWSLSYADYLLEKMRQILKAKFTKNELIYLLVLMDKKMELLLLVLTGLDSTQNTLLAAIYRS